MNKNTFIRFCLLFFIVFLWSCKPEPDDQLLDEELQEDPTTKENLAEENLPQEELYSLSFASEGAYPPRQIEITVNSATYIFPFSTGGCVVIKKSDFNTLRISIDNETICDRCITDYENVTIGISGVMIPPDLGIKYDIQIEKRKEDLPNPELCRELSEMTSYSFNN